MIARKSQRLPSRQVGRQGRQPLLGDDAWGWAGNRRHNAVSHKCHDQALSGTVSILSAWSGYDGLMRLRLSLLFLLLVVPAVGQGNGNGPPAERPGASAGNGHSSGNDNAEGGGNNGLAGSAGKNGSAGNAGNSGGLGIGSGSAAGNSGQGAAPSANAGRPTHSGHPASIVPSPASPAPGRAPQAAGAQQQPENTPVEYLSQDFAREAVNAGQAVSLISLVPDIQARTGGEIIDAEMLNVRGMLVYAVRVLQPSGRVTSEFYYARSGIYIGSE